MKLNSPKSMTLGRTVLREHGGDWSQVHKAGKMRDDGVIVVMPRQPSEAERGRRDKPE